MRVRHEFIAVDAFVITRNSTYTHMARGKRRDLLDDHDLADEIQRFRENETTNSWGGVKNPFGSYAGPEESEQEQ